MRLARGSASVVLATGLLIASSGPVRSERLELLTGAAATPDVAAAQSFLPSGPVHLVSDDGRYVVFVSKAANLVSGVIDRNSTFDVFVRDTLLGATLLVSASVNGGTANGASLWPAISGDGDTVAFISGATDLVPGQVDIAGTWDLFVWRRASGLVRLVTRAPGDPPTALGDFRRAVLVHPVEHRRTVSVVPEVGGCLSL
jgi:hypothetical protein